jgi:Protein of unknown function (DUF2742)
VISIESREIDWYLVHLFAIPMLDRAGSWPLAGSPAWARLDDSDPRKLAAVLDGGRRDALRNDTISSALVDASHSIAESADWSQFSCAVRRRSGVYIPREVD